MIFRFQFQHNLHCSRMNQIMIGQRKFVDISRNWWSVFNTSLKIYSLKILFQTHVKTKPKTKWKSDWVKGLKNVRSNFATILLVDSIFIPSVRKKANLVKCSHVIIIINSLFQSTAWQEPSPLSSVSHVKVCLNMQPNTVVY